MFKKGNSKKSSHRISAERKRELSRLVRYQKPILGEYTRSSNQGNELSVNDLIYIIENFTDDVSPSSAYLRLIKNGELADIKRLSKYMDFNAVHLDDEGAVETACIYGRTDVLHYFVDELGLSLHEFEDYNNHAVEAASQAAKYQQWKTLDELLKPVSEGGLGYKLPDDVLLNYCNDSQVVIAQAPNPNNNNKPLVTVYNFQNGTREDYTLGPKLGCGTYGAAYLFHYNGKVIAVKCPNGNWKPNDYEFDSTWYEAQHEFEYLCKAYPNEGPYALQKMAKKEDGEYVCSYRMVMPFIPGKQLDAMFTSHPASLQRAEITLAVATELQALHDRKVAHGDIRSGNVLITEDQMQSFFAHFIDFDFAYTIGKAAKPIDAGPGKYIAPERSYESFEGEKLSGEANQDVYGLARSLQWAIFSTLYPEKVIWKNGGFVQTELDNFHAFLVTEKK